jgi:PAS domain S-box-containing protein
MASSERDLSARIDRLHRHERRAFSYIREKVNQLLTVMGTATLRPEELDDETLLELDPIGIISNSFTQIIGHLHETNRKLQEAKDEIQAIFDSAGAGIMVLDRNKKVVSFNRKQRESFGLKDGQQVIGTDCCINMCQREPIPERCTFENVMRTGQPFHQTEWTCGGRDYEVFGTPIRNAAGEIDFVVLVYTDVTEYRQIEAELRQAKAELERQNEGLRKLDQLKDNLIHDVSHELKTPVAKHLMQMEMLRSLFDSDRVAPEERQAFEVMEEGIRRQQGTIRDLLDLARLESGRRAYRRERFLLDGLVANLVHEYRRDLERFGVRCTVSVPRIEMIGDEDMLWHVLSNLMTNALKFRNPGVKGTLTIAAEERGDDVVIRVVDNGIGLTPEEQALVFERFFQACPSIPGSGIGMSICHRIVEDLGGTIAIASKGKGLGATVTVTLPRDTNAA